ncbi:MAG: thrombospondin type 3 repeat-containing protein [Anaerolineae bacterium]
MQKLIHFLVVVSLLVSSFPINTAAAAPLPPPPASAVSLVTPTDYLPYIAAPNAQPLLAPAPASLGTMYNIQAELAQPIGPYRTTITIHGAADLARLKQLGVTILATTRDAATLIVDRLQLEQLAKLHFMPLHTELTARLHARGGALLPNTATTTDILAATATDSDNDGLNDTEEGWWCTDPNNPDSNNDKVSDGASVQALIDWLQHKTTTRPASGKPFAGWPPDHAGCYDSDYDSVPDAVEVYVLGLNPNLESTAHDKFDDGQKLFGITNCPGSGGGCGYGALPRAVDWGVIFSQMPSWVKPPYDSPFVAAFPVPEVSVIPGSWKVERVTTITTSTGVMTQTTNTYATTVTSGESDSIANTVTWNNWEEVSQAVSTPLSGSNASSKSASPHIKPQINLGKTLWGGVKFIGGTLGGVGAVGLECSTGIGCLAVGATIVGAAAVASSGWDDMKDGWNENPDKQLAPNNAQNQKNPNTYSVTNINNATASAQANASITLNQNLDVSGVVSSLDGVQYAINQQGALLSRGLHDISFAISQPRLTETHTNGHSWGGAQTTTHTVLEEHSISQGQAFATSQSWSTAYGVDSSYAANLTFNYTVKNTGSDYAREISGLTFNIFLGDDPNPIITYPAWQQFPNGTLSNVFPGDILTFASTPPVHLTLDQMRRIDLQSFD